MKRTLIGMLGVLFIGDSHSVGHFGTALDAKLRTLRTPQSQVASYAGCGSNPIHWIEGLDVLCGYCESPVEGARSCIPWEPDPSKRRTVKVPRLDVLLRDASHVADYTVVALGANLVPVCNVKMAEDQTRQMIAKIHENKSHCIWIGPPPQRQFENRCFLKVYKALETVTSEMGCDMIDLRKDLNGQTVEYPADYKRYGGDGTHYIDQMRGSNGKPMSVNMAEKAFAEIEKIVNQ